MDDMFYNDELWEEEAPAEESDEALLPVYLRAQTGPERPALGTLSYNKKSRCWVVRGDPSVTEMCKRLFPGSKGARRGEARFANHRRMVSDLLWLMLRFPLDVRLEDLPRWQEAVTGAREHALREALASTLPQSMTPPEGTFSGQLMPFQQEGLSFLMRHERTLLADEMGLGKTVQALACLAASHSFPALVIPPPHLCRNWQEEIRRFLVINGQPARVHLITGLKPYPLPEADVYIMHYLLLRGWKTVLPNLGFRAVVFDEIQELRHAGTEKYSAASLLSDSAERVIGLSGTPIYNRGGEIWNVINILDFHFLSQLPPKRRLVQELDWNDRVYASLMAGVLQDLKKWKNAVDLSPQQKRMLEESISLHARQATGVAKAPYVCAFVRALLDGGEKVLLFAHHHQVFDIYREELKAYHPKFITGRETMDQKAAAVQAFMEEKTSVLCISLRSGSGLNLQKATCVVFGELDWSPAVHSQAEDRAHRIGKEDSLLCYYLVSPAGSDALMQETLGLKVSQFVGLMGDTPKTQEQVMEEAGYARRHVEMLARSLQEAMP